MAEGAFGAEVIEWITKGRINQKILNNWSGRGEWAVPVSPIPLGKRRLYSRLHVIEAAIAADLMSLGIPRLPIRFAFVRRARTAGREETQYQTDLSQGFPEFPEFECGSSGWKWVLYPSFVHGTSVLDATAGENTTELPTDQLWPLAVNNTNDLIEALDLHDLPPLPAIVVDISRIVANVDAALETTHE
jgi:hypothetical protein